MAVLLLNKRILIAEQGFTLIEMLFVLVIISVMSLIAVPGLYQVYKHEQTKQFFALMDSDILHLQNQTLGTNNNNRIMMEKDQYLIYFGDHASLVRWHPSHVYTRVSSRISFNNRGTIINPSSYRYYDDEHVYRIVFPLGKGRHYFE